MKNPNLVFLKLGGAAITDKSKPRTPLLDNLSQLVGQIARARENKPDLQILLGHGSGSFGHYSGQKHGTRNGVNNPQEWIGFAEVWKDARALNQLVIQALIEADLPVVAFPPSAWLTTQNREPATLFMDPISKALENGLIPMVNGDVIFDWEIGGTILSTEEVFIPLAEAFKPRRIILASREPGVWEDYPTNNRLAASISQSSFSKSSSALHGSSGMDVTGGMAKKVDIMMALLQKLPETKISIISGIDSTSVYDSLIDKPCGTLLHLD